jgi:hypothetical protein
MIWLETYAKTHLFYILLIAGALVGAHVWLQEHDARVKADDVIKQQQSVVALLQQQIVTNNTQAAAKVVTITKVVHAARTPAQVVQALPQITEVPLEARVAVDNPSQVSVDALPLVTLLGQAKVDAVNLAACTVDLKAETAIVVAKDSEIVALKKKPKFLRRVIGIAKAVGVGVGIGLLISGHL